jgi:transposase
VDPLSSFSNEELIALILQQRSIIEEQAEALKAAQKEIADLKEAIARLKNGGQDKKPPSPPPDWIKQNTKTANPQEGQKKRKKRLQNFTWKRREPTQTVPHACEVCPDCGRGLSGGWEYSRRQIIEIPPIALEVVDHVVMARHCGVCGKDCVPALDYTKQTLGGSHYGHHLLSLIAYLRSVCRLPKQSIQALLEVLLGLHLGLGEISQLLHRVAAAGEADYEDLREEVVGSAYVHADETGWRENGQNGYIWSFSTAQVRYFVYDKSRGHGVPERVLREDFRGVLVSDFYGGYNYYLGLHQRCWVHLLREVHELTQKYPTPGVLAWAGKLRDIYDRAKAFSSECPRARCAARLEFQAQILELAYPYEKAGLLQSVLCSRLIQFEAELFTFVEYPFVPSENNAAERSVRPRVIARKISGGTRSSTGSATMAVLSSLFETWRLRGENCLEACRKMLIASQQPKATQAS